MEQCEYWWQDDETQRCDVIDSPCACGGSNEQCCIKGRAIIDMVRQAEKITLDETSLRDQRRRRRFQEAS